MLKSNQNNPKTKTKKATPDSEMVSRLKQFDQVATLQKLKRQKDVRVKRNQTIQLEMNMGIEYVLRTILLFTTFHTLAFIWMGQDLWAKLLVISIYLSIVLLYKAFDHFHILDLNRRELQLHTGFLTRRTIKPLIRFDQIHGFGVQTYWKKSNNNNSVETIALVAYINDGGIIRLSDQSWWVLWNPFQEGMPAYNKRAKLIADITGTNYVPGRKGCRVFVQTEGDGELSIEHHLIPPNGSMNVFDRLKSRYYRDWKNDPQTTMSVDDLPDVENLSEELIDLALRAEAVDFRKPKQYLNPTLQEWDEYIVLLEKQEDLWHRFDLLEENNQIYLAKSVRFKPTNRTEELYSYETARFKTALKQQGLDYDDEMMSSRLSPKTSFELCIDERQVDSNRWRHYKRLALRYERELGWQKTFGMAFWQNGDITADTDAFNRQLAIYRNLFPKIWRSGPWSRQLLRFPLNDGTVHQLMEDIDFNLTWEARFDQMLFQLPSHAAKEMQPPLLPLNSVKVAQYKKRLEPFIKSYRWKNAVREFAPVILGLVLIFGVLWHLVIGI